MKKISLLFLTGFISLVSYSQHTTPGTASTHKRAISFGLDVGANLSTFNVDNEEFSNGTSAPDADYKTSIHAGAFLQIPIGGTFSLKPQVLYSRQGAEVKQAGIGTTTTEYDEDLNYIYVAPAAVQITTHGGFIVESGPQLGFLISAEQERGGTNVDVKDMRNKLDFLWNVGIGYMTKFGFGVHGRYNHGFSNILSTNANDNNPNGKMSNRLFQVGLMYHFGKH